MDNTGAVPYPLALMITLGVEVPIYVGVLSCAGLLRGWRAWLAAVAVNIFTHPLAWITLTAHPDWLVPVELGVCLVEAALLWSAGVAWGAARRGDSGLFLLAALVANTASVLAGILLYGLIR